MTAAQLLWNFRIKDDQYVGLNEFVKKDVATTEVCCLRPRGNLFFEARIFALLCNLKLSTNRARPSGSRGAIFDLHA